MNKVIRDSVHGDIELSGEEMRLIHTRSFQRLHGLKQLGLTYLVYPAAKHARFEHVLGVMHMAVQIAQRLDQGTFFKDREELKKTLRFAALLHDMGHVPFGHTLEDEMPIIKKHDEPSKGNTFSRMEAAVSEVLRESHNSSQEKPVLQVLRAIDASKDDDRLYALVDEGKIEEDYLVLADIIGNTMCADLFDYIKRDHMMTGIRATYDDRILQYFGVDKHRVKRPVLEDSKTKEPKAQEPAKTAEKTYKRVVVRLVRHGRVRNDALADLLDILKLRYNLSDKVLFHPQKCAAGAMLIKAVSELGPPQEKDLLRYSDDAFLHEHRSHPLIEAILSRDLFKPVFCCGMDNVSSYHLTHSKDELVDRVRTDPALRSTIEKEIEKRLGLPKKEDSVLVYCPKPKMTLKPVRALVQWKDGTIRRLNEITKVDDPVTFGQIEILQDIYPRLWKLYVFVPRQLRSRGHEIQQQFQTVLKDEVGISVTCDSAFQFYLEGCEDYKMGPQFDIELGNRPEYTGLTKEKKLATLAKCHRMYYDQSPPGEVDDHFTSPESIIATRDVKKLAQTIVDAVLGAPEPPEKPPMLLH